MEFEFEVKFYVLGKPFKTTVLAENETAAETALRNFIQSKVKLVSAQKANSDWNKLAVDANNLLDFLSK